MDDRARDYVQARPKMLGAPTPAQPQKKKRTGLLITAIVAVVVLAGGATAFGLGLFTPATPGQTEAGPGSGDVTPDGKPLPPQEPMGAAVFTGAELDWALPTEQEISAIFPGASDFAVSSTFVTYGESEGLIGYPRVCEPLVFHDFSFIAGYRNVSWMYEGGGKAFVNLRQLPTEQQGNDVWADWEAASTSCDSYSLAEHTAGDLELSFTVLDSQSSNYTQGVLGVENVLKGENEYTTDQYVIAAHHGNVIVQFGVDTTRISEQQARDLLTTIVKSLDDGRLEVAAELGLPTS